ncbi:nucleotidyltransferase family protein [Sulfobacillus thermosulfidooxidans]|uniref:nucleotidyltransferase family protein n=1 Tax=Sulfobacillus thermosulfidooxidans TaxID=28034 RepID=UPI0006B5779D|nr:nucleotidyltransferase domain-containing protein [Sulfobacillus thermosulfidooxidans]
MLLQDLSNRRTEILELANRFGLTNIRVFGSQARGTASSRSDVDLLVHVSPGHSLLDLLSFEGAVEALLGCPVDVVSDRGLPPAIDAAIRRDCIPL